MAICNACRGYCEGRHCAVFQAMELRLEFNSTISTIWQTFVTTVDRATTIANTRRLMNSS